MTSSPMQTNGREKDDYRRRQRSGVQGWSDIESKRVTKRGKSEQAVTLYALITGDPLLVGAMRFFRRDYQLDGRLERV